MDEKATLVSVETPLANGWCSDALPFETAQHAQHVPTIFANASNLRRWTEYTTSHQLR
jgi:hypothetical protein